MQSGSWSERDAVSPDSSWWRRSILSNIGFMKAFIQFASGDGEEWEELLVRSCLVRELKRPRERLCCFVISSVKRVSFSGRERVVG